MRARQKMLATVALASALLTSPFALNAQADAPDGIDFNQVAQQLHAALGEVQSQLAAQKLPGIMQVRLELAARRGSSGHAVVLRSDQSTQSAPIVQAGLLWVVAIPEGPVPTSASNPLAQTLENALLNQASSLLQSFPQNSSGNWTTQDFTISFTVSENGSQVQFTPLIAASNNPAGLPVHRLTVTFAVPQ